MTFLNSKPTALIAGSILTSFLSIAAISTPTLAQQKVIMVLDSSGSMAGRIGGVRKIDIARKAVGDLLGTVDPKTKIGLIAYGHRRKGDCNDIQVIHDIGAPRQASMMQAVNRLKPLGKTPLGEAVRIAAEKLKYTEDKATVILISDGKETCGSNPCRLGHTLKAQGVDFKVHVVGFNIRRGEENDLQCLAKNTGGLYVAADNAASLKKALVKTIVVAQRPSPAPKSEPIKPTPKKAKVYFIDNFDGDKLGAHWDVIKPKSDLYVVENGKLTVVFPDQKGAAPTYKTAFNIFRLKKAIPAGDWTMTTRVIFTPSTHGEFLRFGLAKDEKTSLFASLSAYAESYAGTDLRIITEKITTGKLVSFNTTLVNVGSGVVGSRDLALRSSGFKKLYKAYQLRLKKQGRNYIVSARVELANPKDKAKNNEKWKTVQKLTSIRLPGDAFTFFFSNFHTHPSIPFTGEGLVDIDWIKIEAE